MTLKEEIALVAKASWDRARDKKYHMLEKDAKAIAQTVLDVLAKREMGEEEAIRLMVASSKARVLHDNKWQRLDMMEAYRALQQRAMIVGKD